MEIEELKKVAEQNLKVVEQKLHKLLLVNDYKKNKILVRNLKKLKIHYLSILNSNSNWFKI